MRLLLIGLPLTIVFGTIAGLMAEENSTEKTG
jgi:hypothetical protein